MEVLNARYVARSTFFLSGCSHAGSGGAAKCSPFSTKDGRATPRVSIVALVVSDHDREVLTRISAHEPVDIHFAESHVDAWEAMNRLSSPVILYDRDWPDAEWRTTVQALASSPHCCLRHRGFPGSGRLPLARAHTLRWIRSSGQTVSARRRRSGSQNWLCPIGEAPGQRPRNRR